jgi:hypothetical protein
MQWVCCFSGMLGLGWVTTTSLKIFAQKMAKQIDPRKENRLQ